MESSPEGCKYLYGDGTLLPLKSGTFDIVVAAAFLKHMRRPSNFLEEVSRVLRNGGLFVVCDPRPLVLKLGLAIRKFDRQWLFNLWSLKDYVFFLRDFGMVPLALQHYLPAIPVGKTIGRLLEKGRIDFMMLHQIGVFQKT